jgi:hypothetical protein
MPSSLARKHSLHKSRWIRQLQELGLHYEIIVIERLQHAKDLDSRERWWIAFTRAWGISLTNSTSGGEGTRGWHHSDEARGKISDSWKGRVYTDVWRRHISEAGKKRPPASAETRAKIGARHLGMIHSEAAKAKISAANTGRKATPEERARMSESRRGRKLSPEHIEKLRHRTISAEQRAAIAVANSRRGCSSETRAKLSELNTGRKPTKEVREKMSMSQKRKWQRIRELSASEQTINPGVR